MHKLGLFTLVFIIRVAAAQLAPYPMQWNRSVFFGYDGPWQAIVVDVGEPQQTLNLLPGGAMQSALMSKNVGNAGEGQYAGFTAQTDAGIYDASLSNPGSSGSTENNAFPINSQFGSTIAIDGWWEWGPVVGLTGNALDVTDRFTFSGLNNQLSVPNVSISAVYKSAWVTPGGVNVPTDIGLFSLGQSSPVQLDGNTGNLVSQWLAANAVTPSNSFGLHIGSVAPSIPGSLYFGGYDKARTLGNVGIYDIQDQSGDMFVNLININVGWAAGDSPFSASATLSNLLQDSNGTLDSIVVRPNPTVSWLHLPGETCSALAALLPVSLDSSLDLYLWNTSDPAYSLIVKSPAYIEFVFQRSGGASDLSINVPFALLNLTLSSPLADPPVPYFPCKAYTPPGAAGTATGDYHLGRAFLQAAFLGAHWTNGQFWLAQAPGPGALTPSITSITNSTSTIDTFTDQGLWNSSWSQYWSPVPLNASVSSSSPAASSSSTKTTATAATASSTSSASRTTTTSSSLSLAARIAIAVPVSLGAIAILLLIAYLLQRRRRRRRHLQIQSQSISSSSYNNRNSSTGSLTGLKPELDSRLPPHFYKGGMELRVMPKPELDGRQQQQQYPSIPRQSGEAREEGGLGVELPTAEQRQSQRRTGVGMGGRTVVYEMPGVPSPRVGFQGEEGVGVEPRESI